MILYLNNTRFIAYKYKKPMLSGNGGMKWEKAEMQIDTYKLTCHYDSRFGNGIYFEFQNVWYRITISGIYYNDMEKKVDEFCIHPSKTILNFSRSVLHPGLMSVCR